MSGGMKRIALLPLIGASLALPSCSPAGNDPGPGGVTVDEAAALDEAAEMIEARRLPEGALPEQLQADAPVELPPEMPSPEIPSPETPAENTDQTETGE